MQNAFAALGEESKDEDDDVQTVITQMAALTTQSQLTARTTTAETQAAVTAAINQLATNQQAMQQQFAAFANQRNTTYQARTPPAPPITQFTIPNMATSHFGGHGGGQRTGGRGLRYLTQERGKVN